MQSRGLAAAPTARRSCSGRPRTAPLASRLRLAAPQPQQSSTSSQRCCRAAATGSGGAGDEQQQQLQRQEQLQQQQEQQQQQQEQQQLQDAVARLRALDDYRALLAAHADDATLPVLEAALLVARHAHPHLDAAAVRAQLDALAAEVEAGLLPGVRYPARVVKEVNRVLYGVHNFRGNDAAFYSVDNSCINRVLETKQGIPITLSLVYMEVASRVGLRMSGVNLPAHFMLRPEGMEWLVDAFNGGELTALEDAEALLGKLTGYQVQLDPKFLSPSAAISSRALLLRLCNNLRQIYMTRNEADAALAIIGYMQATVPDGELPELRRDEGLCLYALGRYNEAAALLAAYLADHPDSRDSAVVAELLQQIKRRVSGGDSD